MRRHALPLLLGILSGAIGGLTGAGGGLVLVPLLVQALALPQHTAQGTSFGFIIATALVAATSYSLHGQADIRLAAWLAVGALPGVLLGARLAAAAPATALRRGFGLVMVATALRLLIAPPGGAGGVWAGPWNTLVGVAVGVLAGLLGVGGGTLLVPVLVLGEQVEQHMAQGVSLLMIFPVAMMGLWSYARRGLVSAPLLPPLVAGGAIGAAGGALLAHTMEASLLTRLFALLLLALAARMLFGKPRASVPSSREPRGGAA
jgi:uncharacterized membrane protein YfcA